MKVIISPTKKMKIDNDIFAHRQMPALLEESQTLKDYLQSLNYDQLKKIWKCSDKLAEENFERIKEMDLHSNLTPAIFSYQGLQYQHMGPTVFSKEQLDYLQDHLRILSGFYGVLRPFDGIVPYRLEMQAKLLDSDYKNLYEFWDSKIADTIFSQTKCIINLASKEYSKSISKYLTEDVKFITCVFGEWIDGKVVEKGTLAKMARGEMVRFMAENNIKNEEDIKKFSMSNYAYREELSDCSNYIFIKKR